MLRLLAVLLGALLLLPAAAAPTDLLADPVVPLFHVAPASLDHPGPGDGSVATPWTDLQHALEAAPDGAILRLAAGEYVADPQEYREPTCGNCADPNTLVRASTGFVLRGKSLALEGPADRSAVLRTRAGYGFYIEDAPQVTLRGLQITDGRRDRDGAATDGAVVVKHARVDIHDCILGPNPVPAKRLKETIVGICGAVGREGSELQIHDTEIRDNTWDGVAFYRGAVGELTDCVIARGRGAGIGITWDAEVRATRCEVSEYWKGIGSFGTSQATIRNCLVRDLRGWGIIASGASTMQATNNTVVRCGNVGIALWNPEATLALVNNISWGNGTVERWVAPRVGLWWNGDPDPAEVHHNLFGNNFAGDFLFGYEDSEDPDWSLAGVRGNQVGHPLFLRKDEWRRVKGNSPIRDMGDPLIRDRDGSISDLGWTGGPEGVDVPEE